MSDTAYIALGSNMGDRVSYLYNALKEIDKDPAMSVTNCSSIYETAPYGPVEQADFLNLAARLSVECSPVELLRKLQEIEALLDRVRTIHWGPRTIDLDILLYNHENIEMANLKVPHAEMTKRAFVMVPLAELAPSLNIPGTGQSAEMLCRRFKKDPSIRLWRRAVADREFNLF